MQVLSCFQPKDASASPHWNVFFVMVISISFDIGASGCIRQRHPAGMNEEPLEDPLLQSSLPQSDSMDMENNFMEDDHSSPPLVSVEIIDDGALESHEDHNQYATIVIFQAGWYITWNTMEVPYRQPQQQHDLEGLDVWIFQKIFTTNEMVLAAIPERAICDLTYIVYYNPLSDANLMHLQPLQKKTAKQIQWIVIFPELVVLSKALENAQQAQMSMRSSRLEIVYCLADFQSALNMWQALFSNMSIVFPSSVRDPEGVTLFKDVLKPGVPRKPTIINT